MFRHIESIARYRSSQPIRGICRKVFPILVSLLLLPAVAHAQAGGSSLFPRHKRIFMRKAKAGKANCSPPWCKPCLRSVL
jgi:hypothetical protein